MNPSNLHADAARRNGQLSQGPVTAEGKQRSSQNARKHNFFTNITLLPDEDQDAYSGDADHSFRFHADHPFRADADHIGAKRRWLVS